VIFSEHFGENRVILLQTVAKWRCIKLCAIFSGPLCSYTIVPQKISKEAANTGRHWHRSTSNTMCQ